MALPPARAALLLVDVQQDFFARDGLTPPQDILVPSLRLLLDGWRRRGRPVIHVRTCIRADGSDRMPHWQARGIIACVVDSPGYEPPSGLAARSGEPVFHKRFFSAFGAPGLAAELEHGQIDTLVIAGLYSHGCIRASALDAYERGLRVLVADDAIGSTEPLHGELTRTWLDARAARFLPSRKLLDEHVGLGGEDTQAVSSSVHRQCSATAAAARDWARTDPRERAALLERWADRIETESDDLIRLLATEIGKPVIDGADELRRTLAHIRAAARLCRDALSTELSDGVAIRYRPLGTVAAITPWNNPLAIPAGKLAPALAFGNGCVWKPSPRALEASGRLLAALEASGLPSGLVTMIEGDAEVARMIAADPAIDAVSLTGSETAGRMIAAICAAHGKRLQAELGGNNAALILDDSGLDPTALQALAHSVFGFAGQRCTAIRRLIVLRDMHQRFVEAFADAVASLVVGDPLDPRTRVGPLISVEHRMEVERRVTKALGQGARVLARGALPADTELAAGAGRWLAPLVLGDVDPASPIAQQETFGPVALILPADGVDDAIAIGNSVPQGLVGAIYAADLQLRDAATDRLDAGMLKLGSGPMAISVDAPFCGWKTSAIGPPEHGLWDRDFYARVQTLYP